MKLVLIDGKYKGEVKLPKKALDILKKFGRIAVYTTTQFNHKLSGVLKQLDKAGIKYVSSQPERTNAKFQVLGCDMYHGNLKLAEDVDAYLYVGDGRFHPNALLFQEEDGQGTRPVIMYDPPNKKVHVLTSKDVEKVLGRKRANIKRFLMAKTVGVVVTTKPGQEHFHYFKKLEEKYKDKKFYVFTCDTVSFSEMENFPFIQAWINTACPRIGADDITTTEKVIVNAEEALRI